jgi:cation transport regulator ChaC
VLYKITLREMLRLNSTEGIPGGAYRPTWLTVQDAEGRPLKAMTYVADGNPADGRPSLRYISLLREGARMHGLPATWLQLLDNVLPAD